MSLSTLRGETGGVAAGDLRPGARALRSHVRLASGTPNVMAALATSPPAGPAAAFAACTTVSLMDSETLSAVTLVSLPAPPSLVVLGSKRLAAMSSLLDLSSVAYTLPLLRWVAIARATMAADTKDGEVVRLGGFTLDCSNHGSRQKQWFVLGLFIKKNRTTKSDGLNRERSPLGHA